MRRTLKFRAWDAEQSAMVYLTFGFAEMFGYFSNAEQMARFHRLVWMQFTGMYDKAGDEIYEDDIVKVDGSGKCRVVYLDAAMKFYFLSLENETAEFVAVPENIEIIGNAYENPDLLV